MTASRNDDSCNKERKAQDVGDEEIMYEQLLDDIDAETLTKNDFEIDTGSRRGKVGGPGTAGNIRGRAGRRTLAPQANRCYDNERSCSANETTYW